VAFKVEARRDGNPGALRLPGLRRPSRHDV